MRLGQTAPGASLISEPTAPEEASTGPAARQPRSRALLAAVFGVAAFVVAVDQTTKALAVARLTEGVPQDLLGSALRLHLTRNAGAAFSTATGMTWVLTVVALAVVIVVIRVASQLGSRIWALTLGLLLGGALGNLSDRMFRAPGVARGHVVDFLEFPHWPIWNLADGSIVCAGVLIVLLTLKGVRLEGEQPPGGTAQDGRPDA